MPEPVPSDAVLMLARTAARWPRSGFRADSVRELVVPICLSGVGVRSRVWAHLTNRHVTPRRRMIEVPELGPNKVWAARRIIVPKALWTLMAEAVPSILQDDESIHIVSPFIADAYMRGVANLRRSVLRNLKAVADASGVEHNVTWQWLRSSYEASLALLPNTTAEEIDLRLGRKPKTRRARFRRPPPQGA